MTVAFFDLDHTLLAGDTDLLWGRFLGERGLVDPVHHARLNAGFFRAYNAGTLDILEFLNFQLGVLARHDMATLEALRAEFAETALRPAALAKGIELVRSHATRGHRLVIATATNSFVTRPTVDIFGVEQLIATEPEVVDGRFSGRVAGTPSFGPGKLARARAWLEAEGGELEACWFYSDSRNDIPLLASVGHPVAVDPDPVLAAEARRRGWPVISLR